MFLMPLLKFLGWRCMIYFGVLCSLPLGYISVYMPVLCFCFLWLHGILMIRYCHAFGFCYCFVVCFCFFSRFLFDYLRLFCESINVSEFFISI
jgi:hypothetical protein